MARKHWMLAARVLSAAALLAAVPFGLMGAWTAPSPVPAQQSFEVNTTGQELRLACAPGIFDAAVNPAVQVAAEVSVWPKTDTEPLAGGGTAVLPGTVSRAEDFPSALATTRYLDGPPVALATLPCQVPANRLALVGGSTDVGEDTVLILSNPGDKPVTARVRGYSIGGTLGEAPPMTVPAKSTIAWRPAVWFPEEPRLALTVEADGLGVAAWLQSSGFAGEVTRGIAQVGSQSLARELVFPAVGAGAVLNLLNPGDQPVEISLEALSEDGAGALNGTQTLLAEPGVTQLTLPEVAGLRLTGSADLAASISRQLAGAPDPVVEGELVESRELIGPSSALTRLVLPVAGTVTLVDQSGRVEQVQVEAGQELTFSTPRWAVLTQELTTDFGSAWAAAPLGEAGLTESSVQVVVSP